jgi:hypothetical protein
MQKLRYAAFAALLAAAAPSEAEAAELTIRSEFEPESRAMQLDVVLGTHVRRYAGFLPGVFFAYPVAPQGFISTLNDAFYVEGGALLGAFFDPTFFWLAPQAGVRWVFYLTREWAVFGAVRLGWAFEFDDRIDDYTFFYASASVGAHWHFSDAVALRLETGGGVFGYHIMAGISFQL